MPYSNVPENKWPAMESCVEKVMKDHEGEDGFTKKNAIAICHSRIIGSFEIAGAHFEIVTDPAEVNTVLGQSFEPGELLSFKNAELARAEVNANRDELSNDDIGALAATLPLMPLTDEHEGIIGLFTAASSDDDDGVNRLLTEGIMYARRFPDVAEEIKRGTKRLSIEAVAETAICSICGGEFSDATAYCDHLRNRHATGASRRFRGIRAVGGGAVRRPAGSKAGFDAQQVRMIASHQEVHEEHDDDDERKLLLWYAAMDIEGDFEGDLIEAAKEKWAQDVDLDEGSLKALGWPSVEKIASAIKGGKVSYKKAIQKLNYLANVTKDSATKSKARSAIATLKKRFAENKSEGGTNMERDEIQEKLNAALADLEKVSAERDELKSKVDELEASVSELNTKLTASEEERETARAELVWRERRTVLASVLGEEQLDEQKPVIMAMSDDAVKLFVEAAKNTTQPPPKNPVIAGMDDGDDDKVVVSLVA